MTDIAILGAGSWGTAIALHLAYIGNKVTLWGHKKTHTAALLTQGENKQFLPGYPFPETMTMTSDLSLCLQATTVIIAVPSHAFTELFTHIDTTVGPIPQGLCWITKGIEPTTNDCLSQTVSAHWGHDYPFAILSGPSFAKEVAARLPTAITLATNNKAYGQLLQQLFHSPNFRVYLSDDTMGVQLCGAVKNVIAIATGISDGLAFGANARAALITRGVVEMTRLGTQLGACPDTFHGLAGLGDLVLTCTDNQSRNRRFGLQIGQGQSIIDAQQAIGQVVEGRQNASQVCQLANQHQIELPICQAVSQILDQKITAKQAVHQLMTRPLKTE